MRLIIAEKNKPIEIGRYNENEHILVRLPLDDVMEDGATYEVMHQRYGDTIPYPCTGVTVEGNYLYWLITELDVSVQGKGRLEIFSYFGTEGRGKSYIYTTRVLESLGDAGEIPEPYQPYLEQIMEKAQYAKKIAEMTVEAESIPSTEQAEVIKTETEDRINLKFRLPKGEPAPPYDDTEIRELINTKASIIMLHSVLLDNEWEIRDAEENVLTFEEIKALHNKVDYIVCLHQNVIHSTCFLTDAVEFMGTYYINENAYISRLIINSENKVKADGYPLENSDNKLDSLEGYEVGDLPSFYPNADAVVEQLGKKAEVFVAEYGVTTYAEVKNAYESGKIIYCDVTDLDTSGPVRYYLARDRGTSYYFQMVSNYNIYIVGVYDDDQWRHAYIAATGAIKESTKNDQYYPTVKAVADYVADGNNLPQANYNQFGVVNLGVASNGFLIRGDGTLALNYASEETINRRFSSINPFRTLTASNLDYAVKAALTDGKGAEYSAEEKKSARERIGLGEWVEIADVKLKEDVSIIRVNITDEYLTDILIRYTLPVSDVGRNGFIGLNYGEADRYISYITYNTTLNTYGFFETEYNAPFRLGQGRNGNYAGSDLLDAASTTTNVYTNSNTPFYAAGDGVNTSYIRSIFFMGSGGQNLLAGSHFKIYRRK